MTNSNHNYVFSPRLLVLSITVILLITFSSISAAANPVSRNMQVASNQTALVQTTPTELQLGQPIERELAGGAVHIYTVKLEANQYFNAVVEQKGIDVVVRVYNPAGEKIYEVDSPKDRKSVV